MYDASIALAFKTVLGLAVSAFSYLAYRAINTQDKRIEKLEARVGTVETELITLAIVSTKLDMLIDTSTKMNHNLEGLNKRIQGTELGIARLGHKNE